MMLELQDRRLIAALQCVDAVAREPIQSPLRIEGEGIRLIRNRLGFYVATAAPGFADYTRQFDPAELTAPPSGSVELLVTDPRGQYLPRRFQLPIPRSLDSEAETTIFQPVVIPLFPAPGLTRPQPGWAVFRASITDAADNPLPWALIEVTRATDPVINALSQADDRGEALIAVSNLPLILVSADPEPEEEASPELLPQAVTATATVIFDPTQGTAIPNPDDLLARRATLPQVTLPLSVAAARSQSTTLTFTLNPPP